MPTAIPPLASTASIATTSSRGCCSTTPRPARELVVGRLDRQELRGPRHLGRHRHEPGDRRRWRQARVLGRRQHPRGRADRQHRGALLPAPARQRLRPRCRRSRSCSTRAPSTCARGSIRTAPNSRSPTSRATSARRTRRYPFDEEPVEGLTVEDVDGDGRILTMRIADPHGGYKKCEQDPRLMVRARAGRVRRHVLPAAARRRAAGLRRPHDQGQPGCRGAGPEPQLPRCVAPGVRAGRRRRLPDQRARGEGDGRLHPRAPEHRRGGAATTRTAA